jgi:hypothetical protein
VDIPKDLRFSIEADIKRSCCSLFRERVGLEKVCWFGLSGERLAVDSRVLY